MKVVIVGGVAGGAGTAARLRRNDEEAEIVLLEKGPHISYANCGLPYYVGGVIQEKGKLQLQTPQSFYSRFRVDVRTGHEAVSVNLEKKTVIVCAGGKNYEESYDKLVLSPGAEPVVPPVEGLEENKDHIFTLRNVEDSYRIYDYIGEKKPKTCAVVGAGFIGLEIAENLFERGISVSVIEGAGHVLPPLDQDMSHRVHNEIRSQGIGLYLNQMCSGIGKDYVLLGSGERVKADLVILSIGVRPATGFLRDSGIALGRRGEIVVNQYMEASHKDIYALGDAVAVPHVVSGRQVLIPLASPANKQGRIVGDNLCGKRRAYKGSQMFVKTLYDPEGGRILGAQIVGRDGVDKRIDLLANAVRFGQSCYELQEEEVRKNVVILFIFYIRKRGYYHESYCYRKPFVPGYPVCAESAGG